MSAGVPEEHIEAAAEALKQAHTEVVFGESNDDAFRRMAAAVLAVLGLREEWSIRRGQGEFGYNAGSYQSRDAAQVVADHINERFWDENKYVAGAAIAAPNAHPVCRLVSGWVRVEENQ